MVDMIPITNSSNLVARGYDEGSRELRITFKSGATYAYDGVGRETFEGLGTAESPGKYFERWIKNSFSYRRL